MMEQRPGTGKHVQGEEKTRTGSEFVLAKGKGRYRVGRKKRKKNYERMLKKKTKTPAVGRWKEKLIEAVMQTVLGELAGG